MTRRTPAQDRGRRTQQLIIAGASKVFEFKGYAAATLGEIADSSGISQGSMYFHFKTKEQIALAVIQEQHDRMYTKVEEAMADKADPLVQLIYASRAIAQLLIDDVVVRAGINLALGQGAVREASARSYAAWTSGVSHLFQEARATGILDTQLPLENLAQSLVAHFTGIQLMSQATTERRDLVARLGDMWQIFIDANVLHERRIPYHMAIRRTFQETGH
ncbi:MAG: ScbR family autoregulator-binding transcription factor [Micropruina sp.]|uniref:ScbR family autoregulator-binding transcription factor n=1 Tax=Micropruina sp. TaxID=2737536 RepID=UPI0039E2DA2E